LVNEDLYIWNGPNWVLVGKVLGPQGPTGAQGPIGLTGTTKIGYYGAFVETSTITVSNTSPTAIKFPVTVFSESITVTLDSRITFQNTGTYNVQFSLVILNSATGGGTDRNIKYWLAQNGTAITNSAKEITLEPTLEHNVVGNFFVRISNVSTDYIQLFVIASGTSVILKGSAAAGDVPAIPSARVTVNQVG
jgi:hypothetical protein